MVTYLSRRRWSSTYLRRDGHLHTWKEMVIYLSKRRLPFIYLRGNAHLLNKEKNHLPI